MPQPLDESQIWGMESNPYAESITAAEADATQAILAVQYPELVSARGTVDPQELVIHLLDKVAKLSRRIEGPKNG